MCEEKTKKCIELLSPAGDAERLHFAVNYGADAVYLGGKAFGMRAAPQNFTFEELDSAVDYCHKRGVRVYLTCNTLPRNDEIEALPGFLDAAKSCGVDALIVTDLGVISLAKQYAPGVPLHISTQNGIVNYAAARELHKLGASRVVLARELSLADIAQIKAKVSGELELECFVHGAMCVSFSGRCLLSNYLASRDSNAGECAQPCRWKYSLVEEKRPGEFYPIDEDSDGTYILNARDMCMIEHIPELVDAGVTSFKIEGRAKSAYYTAAVTNAYRSAIDGYYYSANKDEYKIEPWIGEEMNRVSSREYCTGFFFGSPKDNAQIFYKGGYKRDWDVVAVVQSSENGRLFLQQRNRIFEGDSVEILVRGKPPIEARATCLQNESGEAIEATPHPMMFFSFEYDGEIPAGSLVRKQRS